MKVVTIIGARPQFIKAAVISRIISDIENVSEVLVHTGQHFDENMSQIFFNEMSLVTPHYNLKINNLNHGAMTGKMLERIEKILIKEKPDWVLVYGDTNSTLAGSLAAKKLHLKVAHVEAGLRSFNMKMPEEINRILTDRVSDILFCPTKKAINNLYNEGFDKFGSKIIQCGDVMQDAAIFYAKKARKPSFDFPPKYILCTIHRAENTDDPVKLKNIIYALEEFSDLIPIIMPIHPRTEAKLNDLGYDIQKSKVTFIPPVGYLEMIWLIMNCEFVMTDSGGLQKEAYFFKKFCITLRDETEWVELVDDGFNFLAGSNTENILNSFNIIEGLKDKKFSDALYGNGTAGKIIVKTLLENT